MKRRNRGKEAAFLLRGITFAALLLLFQACSFDYSAGQSSERNKPDIIMDDIEYVRVRGGDPLVRFQAEHAERWEERQIMEFKNFSFEQLKDRGETINAEGRAGGAVVQIESGDIELSGGVRINIESEDIIISTAGLEWKDKDKRLLGGNNDIVEIQRMDGTSFIGRGFFADARNRTWEFSGNVEGIYVEKKDESAEGRVTTQWIRNTEDYLYPPPVIYSHEEFSPEEQKSIKSILEEK